MALHTHHMTDRQIILFNKEKQEFRIVWLAKGSTLPINQLKIS